MSPKNNCPQLKTTYDQLLAEKKKFDELFNEINVLRPNFSKNLPEIKDKISDTHTVRTEIEDKILEVLYYFENNSEKVLTVIKKYSNKTLARIERKVASQKELNQAEILILYDIKDKIIPQLDEEQKNEIIKIRKNIFDKIEKKSVNQQELNRVEVILLYDIQDKIIPNLDNKQQNNIKKIRNKRDKKDDVSIVFDCQPEEIARDEKEVNQNTKVFIGELFPRIFQMNQLNHIATSFPEGIIKQREVIIGGKSKNQLIYDIKKENIIISYDAMKIIDNCLFDGISNLHRIRTVCLKLKDLGFTNSANTNEIYIRAKKFGLNLCSAEIGLQKRLQDKDQFRGDLYLIAMEQVRILDDYDLTEDDEDDGDKYKKSIFSCSCGDKGLMLDSADLERWDVEEKFVFTITKEN